MELSEDIKNNVRDGNATAWRLESSLREFPNITPVNFWFEYPVHRVDDGGDLGGMPAQGTRRPGKLNNPKSKTSDEAPMSSVPPMTPEPGRQRHRGGHGGVPGISDKTVYSRLKKMDGEFVLEKGVIRRVGPADPDLFFFYTVYIGI